MKKYLGLFAFLILLISPFTSAAQTIINKYAAVISVQSCNSLFVDTASDFNIGDTVLMIQMKGAVIDSSNTASFGNVLNYHGAGNYEYNVVKAKSGNNLTLFYDIQREYNIPEGRVQLVRVPSYQNYAVNQTLTCMPWNGNKGGVFAVHVTGTFTMNQDIDVSGKGFRGASGNPSTIVGPPSICTNPRYYMGANFDSTSRKGEGITEVSMDRAFGRGKLGNGGGGGNTCNAGGGGGGNGNTGGIGGSEYMGCNNNPANNNTGGLGGLQLAYTSSNNKIFMGGGGGAGQANNLNNTAGGKGGGICIITAGSIAGNTREIRANGEDAPLCTNNGSFGSCHDGMGGGGAGGAILINTNTVSSITHISLTGGKGANESGNAGYFEVGPGGGGAGGVLWTKPATTPSNLVVNNSGGLNGRVLYNNSAWGAQPGQDGLSLNNLTFNFPTDTFSTDTITANFSDSAISCYTYQFTDKSTSLSPTGLSWQWLFPGNNISTQRNPSFTFPDYGTYTVTLVVASTSGCTTSDTVIKTISIPYQHFAYAGEDTITCPGGTITLQAAGGTGYSWLPATGLSSPHTAATEARVMQTTTFIVTVTNNQGCVDKDSVTIVTVPGQSVSATADGDVINCDHKTVMLSASDAISYRWSPGIYCDDSTSATPRVRPNVTTVFSVTAVSAVGCISQDTITVQVFSERSEIFVPNAFSPNDDGLNDDIGPFVLCGFTLEQFSIFNRWGQQVFQAQGPYAKWDGRYNGKNAELGTYYYYIRGKDDNGDRISFKGNFILIR
ncbi:gliding motility-associated C-terminal domain-containing protein [Taibaiella chishuiensis]|uniref:Gliding motility-associated-like protein n=1 Tax=Taibaiella chishuiensis TaxID=1434707 RepID=A0A2P8DA89_9BACT|nr:gliding motility-associated C-terminal domain-containing protein [Taibaiella chishuiensis]PSK94125.1 gliding motility-associated-like protein [Taibaiella chishuiensis]